MWSSLLQSQHNYMGGALFHIYVVTYYMYTCDNVSTETLCKCMNSSSRMMLWISYCSGFILGMIVTQCPGENVWYPILNCCLIICLLSTFPRFHLLLSIP